MSKVEQITTIISGANTTSEVTEAISKAYPRLSKVSCENIAKDCADFVSGKMTLKELEHWLGQYGI